MTTKRPGVRVPKGANVRMLPPRNGWYPLEPWRVSCLLCHKYSDHKTREAAILAFHTHREEERDREATA